jgi:hypothetical protein
MSDKLETPQKGEKIRKLQSHNLSTFPKEIFDIADSLEHLDLSNNPISSLPSNVDDLHKLKILFLSNCEFKTFPDLSRCPNLEMVAFRRNGMTSIPENVLPPRLRWLILTDNNIEKLPDSIGDCSRLEKVMLAGNRLTSLPSSMAGCGNLTLLRLSSNRLTTLPPWLLTMPSLAFLSLSSNPLIPPPVATSLAALPQIRRSSLTDPEVLGTGASGTVYRCTLTTQNRAEAKEVAVKVYKSGITSDGLAEDEFRTLLALSSSPPSSHPNLIPILGRVVDDLSDNVDGSWAEGLVMRLIPKEYHTLGGPPSLASCTRDTYDEWEGRELELESAVRILGGVAGAMRCVHGRGVAHGDCYAHNLLVSGGRAVDERAQEGFRKDDDEGEAPGHAYLADFGAATVYGNALSEEDGKLWEKIEVRAFGYLVEDLLKLCGGNEVADEATSGNMMRLYELWGDCTIEKVEERPSFEEICGVLEEIEKSEWDRLRN